MILPAPRALAMGMDPERHGGSVPDPSSLALSSSPTRHEGTGWIGALAEHAAAGRPAVLVTVLRTEGSTPR